MKTPEIGVALASMMAEVIFWESGELEYLRTRVMTLMGSMTWITFVPANEFAISRKTRMGILPFLSIVANVNSQLPFLMEHVLGLNRQITPDFNLV